MMNTRLEICRAVEAAGAKGLKGVPANPLFRSSAMHKEAALFADAVEQGLVEVFRINQAHHYFRITEAGRFYLRTSVTGPAAHSILADIDAEMAGRA